MGRLINDFRWAFGKKPRAVIHYLSPEGKVIELAFEPTTKQGGKYFEIPIKGQDQPKSWELLYAPYKDELGRDVYICPYNAITNINYDQQSENERTLKLIDAFEPALMREFYAGIEFEQRRAAGKSTKKKGFPIMTILLILGVVVAIVIFAMMVLVYFSGGV
jgi:hypothetical protein